MRHVLCLFLLACACSSASTSSSGGSDATTFTDIASALDAPDGTVADSLDSSATAPVCVSDKDAQCDTDSNCGSGHYCDPCARVCKPVRQLCAPCTSDRECDKSVVDGKPWSACLSFATGGSFCGLGCLSDAACGPGYTCADVQGLTAKQCVPKTGTCGGGGACKTDVECPYGSVCNPDWGACVKGCTSDTMCANGTVCALGHCVPPCTGDGDCASLSSAGKCVAQKCAIPGGCLDSTECPDAGSHCDLTSHKCAAGCLVDSDCKDFGKACAGGVCKPVGCTKNWQCALGQTCDVASGQCVADTSKLCAPCDPNDDKVSACGGKPALCVSMQDAQGTDKGAFCALPCGTAPGGPCPQGWACKEVKDDKGTSQGSFCFRPCYQTPVAKP